MTPARRDELLRLIRRADGPVRTRMLTHETALIAAVPELMQELDLLEYTSGQLVAEGNRQAARIADLQLQVSGLDERIEAKAGRS